MNESKGPQPAVGRKRQRSEKEGEGKRKGMSQAYQTLRRRIIDKVGEGG
jgi:hypothetical protein